MMKRLSFLLLLFFVVLPFCVFAQVRRLPNDGVTPPISATAADDAPPAGQRRAAIVTLIEPSLSDQITRTEPQMASVRGAGAVNTARIRERMFADEGQSRLASIQRNKAPIVDQIQKRGINVRSQAEHLLNAIMVEATEEDLAWLRTLPGVASAEFSGVKHATLDAATALVGATQVWTAAGGQDQAGRGVKVAIVDSGIDQTHPMFSDSGFSAPSGFPKSNPAANGSYTNNKIIVAKNYVCPATGTCSGATSFDHNASDGAGHGTFVAGIVAGRSTVSPLGTSVAGIAGGAYLGSYKVFSSTGSASDANVLQAFNDAVADGFDVVNFSGGGAPDAAIDAQYAAAVKNGVNAGVVFVFPSGNCGPNPSLGCTTSGDNTIESPGLLADAITAGASTNSRAITKSLHVLAPGPVPGTLQSIAYSASDTPALTSQLGPATLADVLSLDATRQACGALPAGSLSGAIALIQRGNCNFSTKAINAQNAGAIGVLFYDNISESVSSVSPGTSGPPAPSIPSAIVTQADGASLEAFIAAHPGQVQVRLDITAGPAPETADLVADYSGRGPNNDFSVKPDLVAPGDIYGPTQTLNPNGDLYDASRFAYAEGTSFATPMTAGAAAVLKQRRPTLTVRDIKSALVNSSTLVTATQDGATLSVMHSGGGRLNLPAALATTLVSDPVSLSFGLMNPGTIASTQTVTLKNIGSGAETLNVTLAPSSSDPGFSVTVDRPTVTIAAGATASLNVTLAASAQEGGVFEGFVNLVSQSTATSIRIPYWVMLGTPSAATGGLVDGASFGPALGVGSIVSLFGSNMGSVGLGASSVPLPVDLNHTTVTITGRDTSTGGTVTRLAPLFYGSNHQLNFQLPFTLTTGRVDSVRVAVAGEQGNTLSFTVAAAAPGIFTSNGTAILVHGDFSLVTASKPAQANEVVSIFCTGLGAVTPVVQTGFAAPVSPLAQAATTTATVGGKAAAVQFSGLTPGYVGLYQVNVTVPTGLASGPQAVTVTVGSATSPAATTYIK